MAKELQLIGFKVGGEFCALDIMSVTQVIPYQKPLPLAQAPAFIQGIIHLRGMVIPILDMRRRFGVEVPSEDMGRIIIVRLPRAAGSREDMFLGLAVDAATQVIRSTPEALLHAPDVLTQDAAYTGEVYKDSEGRLFMLLNLEKVLSPQERKQLNAGTLAPGGAPAGSK